jgi:hypothetical protein
MGVKRSEESRKKQSERMKSDYASGKRKHPLLGKKFSDESRKKMSDSHKGKPAPTKGMKIPKRSGEKHWNWQGGKSSYKHSLRNSIEWKQWRLSVFERDGYQCQECGVIGGYLEPHHIVPIRSDKTNLFNSKNGITLCRPCHQKTIWKESNYQDKYLKIVAAQM